MAGQRPYLSHDLVIISLEMILAMVKLVLHRKKESRGKEGENKWYTV